MLVPVVGVELAADNGVAVLLNLDDGCSLVVRVGLLVDVVGRPEVKRLHAQFAGEEALGKLYFKVEPARWNFTDVGMRIGVVADLVALAHHALHDAHVLSSLGADHEEGPLGVLLLQDVQNLWSPLGIWAVVE